MWWPRKKRRHADQKAQKVSGSKEPMTVSLRVTARKISQMEVVEDFDWKPHKAIRYTSLEHYTRTWHMISFPDTAYLTFFGFSSRLQSCADLRQLEGGSLAEHLSLTPGSSTGGSRTLPLDRSSGRSAIQLETQEVLCSWLKMRSVFQEPSLANNMTRRIRQLEEENLLAEMQASKELDKRCKTPSLGGGNPLVEGTSPEAAGTSSVADDLFGELGRELCGMADAHGKTTTSTMSSNEMSWIDEQVLHSTAGPAWDHLTKRSRMVLAERGHHPGARMCSTMEELAGTKNVTKLGGRSSHLVDSIRRRFLAKSLEQVGPRHLWRSLRCGSYSTSGTCG